jgi:hypothetical protein
MLLVALNIERSPGVAPTSTLLSTGLDTLEQSLKLLGMLTVFSTFML